MNNFKQYVETQQYLSKYYLESVDSILQTNTELEIELQQFSYDPSKFKFIENDVKFNLFEMASQQETQIYDLTKVDQQTILQQQRAQVMDLLQKFSQYQNILQDDIFVEQESQYSCQYCDKTFSNPQKLGGHLSQHKRQENIQRKSKIDLSINPKSNYCKIQNIQEVLLSTDNNISQFNDLSSEIDFSYNFQTTLRKNIIMENNQNNSQIMYEQIMSNGCDQNNKYLADTIISSNSFYNLESNFETEYEFYNFQDVQDYDMEHFVNF